MVFTYVTLKAVPVPSVSSDVLELFIVTEIFPWLRKLLPVIILRCGNLKVSLGRVKLSLSQNIPEEIFDSTAVLK